MVEIGFGVCRLVTPASHHMIEGRGEVAWKDSREQLIKTPGKAWRGCVLLGGGEENCEEEKKKVL